jgi:hypothetical protein
MSENLDSINSRSTDKNYSPIVDDFIHTDEENFGRIKVETDGQPDIAKLDIAMGMAELEDRERAGEKGLNINAPIRSAIYKKVNEQIGESIDSEERKAKRSSIHEQIKELGYALTPEESVAIRERMEKEDADLPAEAPKKPEVESKPKQKTRLEYPLENEKPSSITDIAEFLLTNEFDFDENYYEFELSSEVTAEEIKMLLKLPFEVALTEKDGVLILTTGEAHYIWCDDDLRQRRDHSRVYLHTHPIHENNPITNTPSFSDVYITDFIDDSTVQILACETSIMIFSKPRTTDKKYKKYEDLEARDIMMEYGQQSIPQVSIFGLGMPGRRWSSLNKDEQIEYERKFAEETEVIVKEALWDDLDGVAEIMDLINLRR